MQAYWQSAIAAKPSAAHHGYLLGGLMWFCIPFTLATTLGLSALALDLPISIAESNAGARGLSRILGFGVQGVGAQVVLHPRLPPRWGCPRSRWTCPSPSQSPTPVRGA